MSEQWLRRDPEAAGVLYVDGHVRVYHGELAVLPRRHVSRERLCLRGTTDYWVNDQIGQPYFVVSCEFNDGLLKVLREQIVPRLLREAPGQPTAEPLQADPWRHRFLLVFDREGSSPAFFKDMWQNHRIACVSYRKQPTELWDETEFAAETVSMPGRGIVNMRLAERGSELGQELWVREIRKLSQSGQQTRLITTAYGLDEARVAAIKRLRPLRKQFLDTIKMIAYRAETGLCALLRDEVGRLEDVRPLIRDLFRHEANLFPDPEHNRLTVEIHHMTNSQADAALAKLLDKLNALVFPYPGTNLVMYYKLVS